MTNAEEDTYLRADGWVIPVEVTATPLIEDGTALGASDEVALDPGLDAGAGDVVLVAKEGAVVGDLFPTVEGELPVPANAIIVAVVDDWTLHADRERRG